MISRLRGVRYRTAGATGMAAITEVSSAKCSKVLARPRIRVSFTGFIGNIGNRVFQYWHTFLPSHTITKQFEDLTPDMLGDRLLEWYHSWIVWAADRLAVCHPEM